MSNGPCGYRTKRTEHGHLDTSEELIAERGTHFDEEADELFQMGEIQSSVSPFIWKNRVCFGFRDPDKDVTNSRFHLHRLRELVQKLTGVSRFLGMDVTIFAMNFLLRMRAEDCWNPLEI